ncbi:MAG: 30S ribosomal protein S6 [Patescibacteria group bacterium]|jgi:ribosomal protein S6
MKHYEVTFIHREEADPGVAPAIEALGGQITNQRPMGRRQFAYPIGKETAGYYTTLRTSLESDTLAPLNKQLRLMPGLVRYLIVALPNLNVGANLEGGQELAEAKELEKAPTANAPEQSEDDPERAAKLQAQLDKLLGDDAKATK